MDGQVVSDHVEMARPILASLAAAHARDKASLELLNAHYLGRQPLSYMAPELIMELGDRLRQVVVHWPELVIDSTEERLDVEGFRLGGEAEADDDLWGIWQGNGMDLHSHQGQIDALVMRRSYVVVGARSEADIDPSSGVGADVPLMTVESPLEVFAARDPRTRRVRDAAKWWCRPVPTGPDVECVTLYLPNSTSHFKYAASGPSGARGWVLDEDETVGIDEHNLGVVPVVPLVNRPRTAALRDMTEGTSDLDAIVPLSDAACKIATDMMVGAEYAAMPRRYVLGASQADFTDTEGRPVSAFSRIAGRVWALESPEAKVGQWPEANLSGYHDTLNTLAQLVASVAGLPPHYLGMSTDNPASADAIRSGEARLIKRVERRQRCFGEGWEQAMRIALLIRDGKLPPGAARMETNWRDAATPTIAQAADAAVKLFAAGIVTRRQTWNRLGISATEQALMEQEYDRDAERAAKSFGLGPDQQMPGEAPADLELGDPSGTAA